MAATNLAPYISASLGPGGVPQNAFSTSFPPPQLGAVPPNSSIITVAGGNLPSWNEMYRVGGDDSFSMSRIVPPISKKAYGQSMLVEGGPVTAPFMTDVQKMSDGGEPPEYMFMRGEFLFISGNPESPQQIYKFATIAYLNLQMRIAYGKFQTVRRDAEQQRKCSSLCQRIMAEYVQQPECNRQLLNSVSVTQCGNVLRTEEYEYLSYMSLRAINSRWRPIGFFSNDTSAGHQKSSYLINVVAARVAQSYPYWKDVRAGDELYFYLTRHYDTISARWTYFELKPARGITDGCHGFYKDEFGFLVMNIPYYIGTATKGMQTFASNNRYMQEPPYYRGIPGLLGQLGTLQDCVRDYINFGTSTCELAVGEAAHVFPAESVRTLPIPTAKPIPVLPSSSSSSSSSSDVYHSLSQF